VRGGRNDLIESGSFIPEDSSLQSAHVLESQQCSERQRRQRGGTRLNGIPCHPEEGGARNERRLTRGCHGGRFSFPSVPVSVRRPCV